LPDFLDLAAAFFPADFAVDFAVLPAAFAVAVLLFPPCVAAGRAATQWVAASRLAQASAATSADRYRRIKAVPPNPANRFAPNLVFARPN